MREFLVHVCSECRNITAIDYEEDNCVCSLYGPDADLKVIEATDYKTAVRLAERYLPK